MPIRQKLFLQPVNLQSNTSTNESNEMDEIINRNEIKEMERDNSPQFVKSSDFDLDENDEDYNYDKKNEYYENDISNESIEDENDDYVYEEDSEEDL